MYQIQTLLFAKFKLCQIGAQPYKIKIIITKQLFLC